MKLFTDLDLFLAVKEIQEDNIAKSIREHGYVRRLAKSFLTGAYATNLHIAETNILREAAYRYKELFNNNFKQ